MQHSELPTPVGRCELDFAYFRWVHRPGEHLSVLDNLSDLENCIKRVGANATTLGAMIDPQPAAADHTFVDDLSLGRLGDHVRTVVRNRTPFTAYLGEFNNPWFMNYSEKFISANPDSWMRDPHGKRIELRRRTRSGEKVVPVTAIDDAAIMKLAGELIRKAAHELSRTGLVAQWGIGTEESYPELFGLPHSDFRPAFWHHFGRWLETFSSGHAYAQIEVLADGETPAANAWYAFREHAMSDRAASYMRAILDAAPEHPAFYPTHNSLFCRQTRRKLGQPAALMAGASDGLEMGHITIDDDDERLNPLVNAHFSSFGKPIIVPRLANKTLDPNVAGGGRSFTPRMLRRLVYESLGQGCWHIGPIHWSSTLHDGVWHIKDTPAEKECRDVFGEITALGPILAGAGKVQPQVALLISEETWRDSWNPRWTGFYQDSLVAHWNMSVVSDLSVGADLAVRTPVLISVDNRRVSRASLDGVRAYLAAGGRILACGPFAELDENYRVVTDRSIQNTDNFLALTDCDSTTRRRLIAQFHNGEGAFSVEDDYYPVLFENVSAAIDRVAPDLATGPFKVRSADPAEVNVFPLTDRHSLFLVVINMSDRETSATITPPDAGAKHHRLRCANAITGQPLDGVPHYSISLRPYGTAVVWFYPIVTAAESDDAFLRAEEAIAAAQNAGYDVETQKSLLQAASKHATGSAQFLVTKKWTISQSVLGSAFVKPDVISAGNGAVTLRALVTTSDLLPLKNANVSARFTPGSVRRIPLSLTHDSVYTATVEPNDVPAFYDPERHAYRRFGAGMTRVTFDVTSAEGIAGGAVVNIRL